MKPGLAQLPQMDIAGRLDSDVVSRPEAKSELQALVVRHSGALLLGPGMIDKYKDNF